MRRVNLNIGATEPNQFGHFAAQDVYEIGQIRVYRGVSALRFCGIVIRRSLLGADERDLGGRVGFGAQIGEFFGAHVPFALELGHHNRALQYQLLARFVPKWNRPATVFVKAFDRVNQMP